MEESKGHAIAVEQERNLPDNERTVGGDIGCGPSQPRVDTLIAKSSRDAHCILLKTAYELAMTPTIPLSHFAVLVKVLKNAKVQIIQGTYEIQSQVEISRAHDVFN